MEEAHQGDALINTNDPFPPPQPQKKGRKMRAAGKLRKKNSSLSKGGIKLRFVHCFVPFFLRELLLHKNGELTGWCAWVERK